MANGERDPGVGRSTGADDANVEEDAETTGETGPRATGGASASATKPGRPTAPAWTRPTSGTTAATAAETRILVIDNYDSFAYNLVQYVGEVAEEVVVRRNDAIDLAAVRELEPTGVVVSPGPGTPEEAGISVPLFAETDLPILGVCLGHQALCAANGAPVVHAPEVVHGKPSVVTHDGRGVFDGLPERFQVGRYHSLAVERDDLPDVLLETARTTDDRGVLMAVRHREKPHVGVQFHPESILTREESAANADRDAGSGLGAGTENDAARDGISLALGKSMIERFCRLAATARGTDRGDRGE